MPKSTTPKNLTGKLSPKSPQQRPQAGGGTITSKPKPVIGPPQRNPPDDKPRD